MVRKDLPLMSKPLTSLHPKFSPNMYSGSTIYMLQTNGSNYFDNIISENLYSEKRSYNLCI